MSFHRPQESFFVISPATVDWRAEARALSEQSEPLRKNAAAAEKRLAEVVPDEAAQRRLEKAVEVCRAAFDKADAAAGKLRDENDEMCRQITQVSKQILDGPKENLGKIKKLIADTNAKIVAAEVEIKVRIFLLRLSYFVMKVLF